MVRPGQRTTTMTVRFFADDFPISGVVAPVRQPWYQAENSPRYTTQRSGQAAGLVGHDFGTGKAGNEGNGNGASG